MLESSGKPNIVFAHNFLNEVDGFLKSNGDITCGKLKEIFTEWNEASKEFRGNANGITGYSEFLLYRFLCHRLGCIKPQVEGEGNEIRQYFVNESKKILIKQNFAIKFNGSKVVPDISIWKYIGKPKDYELIAIIEIKIYLTHGKTTFFEEFAKITKLRESQREFKALLVNFNTFGKVVDELKIFSQHHEDWFNFFSLEDEAPFKLVDKLNEKLLKAINV